MTRQRTNQPLTIPKDAEPGWRWVLPRGVTLTLDANRELRDAQGTVYAAMDERLMTDKDDRAGASGVYLSEENVLSRAAPPHEFQTSSTTYQRLYSNEDCREDFLKNARLLARPGSWRDRFWIWVAGVALKRFQDAYWDNERTRWTK